MVASFESGLPGTGPPPVHLHTGNPTPHSEGCVVRFTPQSGEPWIGNLQSGHGYATKIIDWPEAKLVVVISAGAAYLIRPETPNAWKCIDDLAIDCVIAPTRDLALISTYSDVVAISVEGALRWRRTVAVDGVEITEIRGGLIHGNAGIDPPDGWRPFVLALATGRNSEQPDSGRTE